MESELTLVTGFWPQKQQPIRTSAVYVRLFAELLAHIDGAIPIVCCADPSLESVIEKAIAPFPNVRLSSVPTEDLRYVRQRERFVNFVPASNSNPLRDTIDYAAIVWSKPDVVNRVAQDIHTSHVGWIDFGLPHVVELMDVDWQEVVEESVRTERIRVCERYATAPSEVADPWYFYSNNSARIAGGLMTGPRDVWSDFTAHFDAEIERMIPTGTYALEEQVLAALTVQKPDMFERWFADYFGMLKNVRHIRRDIDTILTNLHHCRADGIPSTGASIVRVLLDSGASHLRLEPEQCFHVIDDGLACAVHADSDLADILAKTALSLFHYSRLGRGMMKGIWRRSLLESLKVRGLEFADKPWTWEELTARPEFPIWMSCF